MIKVFVLNLLFSLIVAFSLKAQTTVQKARFSYTCVFNILFDRGQRFVSFNSMLFSDDFGSSFYLVPSASSKEIESNATEITIQADTLFRVIKDFVHEGMIFGDITFNGREKLYRDTLHAMKWALHDEKKLIDSLLCFKATTSYKGRNYTAWYCPTLPVPNGPWKLGGLPGLIIEAYEEQKDLYFLLSGIQYNDQLNVQKIHQYQDYPDYSSFLKYWKNFFDRINGSMAAQDNPGCVSCLSQTKTKIYTWEKIPVE